MGAIQNTLTNKGYIIGRNVGEDGVEATKDEDKFIIRWFRISTNEDLVSQMETLKETSHCHIVNTQNSFKDEDQGMYYVVIEDCQGGTLAEKLRGMTEPFQESEALSLIVELCLTLRTMQDKGLLHPHLTPQAIFLTELGMLRLGGFGKIQESASALNPAEMEVLNYLPPETLTSATYDAKSVVWSVGCILYELRTKQQAFSADTRDNLISRITSGPDPVLRGQFSSEFLELLSDMLSKNLRPSVHEILRRPIVVRCLLTKCKSTTELLKDQPNKLKCLADDLGNINRGTTIGSLTGGVIGAVGVITCIVGLSLVLAPHTFGTLLIVAGIGASVSLAGGLTASTSNIIKAVNESSHHKAFKSIIGEVDDRINALNFWLREIDNSLQTIRQHDSEDNEVNSEEWAKVSARAARNLGEVGQVATSTTTMTQISRVAQVAGTASAVFSGLFVAADVFFIVRDAKELNNINQAGADGNTRSEVMKFVESIRKAAKELQKVLDEVNGIIVCIESLKDDRAAVATCGVNADDKIKDD